MLKRLTLALFAGAVSMAFGSAVKADPIFIDTYTISHTWSIASDGSAIENTTALNPTLRSSLGALAVGANGEVYSNITNASGFSASAGSVSLVGGASTTRLVADDLTFDPATTIGAAVTQATFSITNNNAAALTVRPRVTFYAADTVVTGNPTTVLASYVFNPVAMAATSATAINFVPTGFTVPADAVNAWIWAAVTFDNGGGATATAAQMNAIGELIYNPPTIGTSDDVFFRSTAANDGSGANPAGNFFYFGGNPVANFYWEIRTAVPEPGTIGLAAVGLCGLVIRRRRA